MSRIDILRIIRDISLKLMPQDLINEKWTTVRKMSQNLTQISVGVWRCYSELKGTSHYLDP